MNIFLNLIKSALASLGVNRLRTFLTVLGIVIGIIAVITLLNLGQAAQKQIEASVSSIGSNLITIIPGKIRSNSGFTFNMTQTFTLSEVEQVRDAKKYFVAGVTATSNTIAKVQYDGNITNLTIVGIYGDYWQVRNIEVIQGRSFSDRESNNNEKVAVIGPDLINDVFNGENPVGKKIKLNNQNFTVIGVTKAQGSNGFTNPDANIFIPFTTMDKALTGSDKVPSILASAKDPKFVQSAQDELATIMRRIHNIEDPADDDFTIRNAMQALSILNQITDILTVFLTAIGAISLLVGGIGIMNIMFVTVNERTREIGLRKALGATKNDILLQFLAEAVVVTLLGGLFGTVVGILLTFIVTALASLTFQISATSVLLAVGVSATIGLIFGIYPAWKAAQLSPIDALRYE